MVIRNDIINAIIEALNDNSGSYEKLLDCVKKYEIKIKHPTSMTYQQQQSFIRKSCVMLLEYTKINGNRLL